MTLLSKQQILNADDLSTEDVPVPEWGGVVRVKALTGKQRGVFEASLVIGEGRNRRPDYANSYTKLVAASVVDENGARLFNESEVALLGAKSGAALNRVFKVAQRLSGLGAEVEEEEVKKSSEALNGSPSLISPSPSEDSPTPTSLLPDLPADN